MYTYRFLAMARRTIQIKCSNTADYMCTQWASCLGHGGTWASCLGQGGTWASCLGHGGTWASCLGHGGTWASCLGHGGTWAIMEVLGPAV